METEITRDNLFSDIKIKLTTAQQEYLDGKKGEAKRLDSKAFGDLTDEEFQEYFPPRTKSDLVQRRGRADLVRELYLPGEWARVLRMVEGLDYISATMMLLLNYIHGDEWWKPFYDLGANASWIHLQSVCKVVTDRLKHYPTSSLLRRRYVEVQYAIGNLNLPVPDWNPLEEAIDLAHGGVPHGFVGLDWYSLYRKAAEQFLTKAVHRPAPYITLYDYIHSSPDAPSGASSIGKIVIAYEAKLYKIKARKNMLLDVFTPEYLYTYVKQHLGMSTNVAFFKIEPGKVRLAVTGDTATYYAMSWLVYLSNHPYKLWDYNTLDENSFDLCTRLTTMVEMCADHYSMPSDFARFDHQPETEELAINNRSLFEYGRYNTDEWIEVSEKTITAAYNSKIIYRGQGKEVDHTIKVTGGLESGKRDTSSAGNMWNSACTRAVLNIVEQIVGPVSTWIKLRGDDTANFDRSPWLLLLLRWTFKALGIDFNAAKFGLHYGQSEFLRIWFDEHEAYGYPNRSALGIIQYKSSSSEPWDPDELVMGQLRALWTTERRLSRTLPNLQKTILTLWQKRSGMPLAYLSGPSPWGRGFGDYDYQRLDTTIPTLKKSGLHPQLPQRPPGLDIYTSFDLSADDIRSIQVKNFTAKMASDDVSLAAGAMRREYREMQRRQLFSSQKTLQYIPEGLPAMEIFFRGLASPQAFLIVRKMMPKSYGIGKSWIDHWTVWKTVKEYRRDFSPMDQLIEEAPHVADAVHLLERRGLYRSEAMDWVFGTMSNVRAHRLHPEMAQLVEAGTVAVLAKFRAHVARRDREVWPCAISSVSTALAAALAESPLSKYYRW
jgi:hypothetical protein